MFCPKCSQQQVSERMRFCSRCGFALAGVEMLLRSDGALPQPLDQKRFSRNRIMKESAIFTFIAWLIALGATNWFDYGGPFEDVAIITAVLFFILSLIGLIRFLYGFIFVKEDYKAGDVGFSATDAEAVRELEAPRSLSLSSRQTQPASEYSARVNTKEIVPRASVTENTTKLLEDQ